VRPVRPGFKGVESGVGAAGFGFWAGGGLGICTVSGELGVGYGVGVARCGLMGGGSRGFLSDALGGAALRTVHGGDPAFFLFSICQ